MPPVTRSGNPHEVRAGRITKLSKSFSKSKKPLGLSNPPGSNFCFRNTPLQLLLHAPQFLDWLDTVHDAQSHRCLGATLCMLCAVYNIKETYWNADRRSRTVERRLNAARDRFNAVILASNSRRGEQPKWRFGATNFGAIGEFIQYVIGRIGYRIQDTTALKALFGIAEKQTCFCYGCSRTWTLERPSQWYHWWTIMCPCDQIPFGVPPAGSPPFTVRQLLDEPYVTGLRDPTTSVQCSVCGYGLVPQTLANRSFWKIEAAPAMLFIEFQRVKNDPTLGQQVREWPITIPESLDMSSYQSNPVHRATRPLRYTLQGVIYINVSQNVLPGNQHFTMAVKNPRGVFYIDDQNVQQWRDRTRLRRSTQVIRLNQQGLTPGTWRPCMLMFSRDD